MPFQSEAASRWPSGENVTHNNQLADAPLTLANDFTSDPSRRVKRSTFPMVSSADDAAEGQAIVSPLGEKSARKRPWKMRVNSPVATSHNLTGPSFEEVAKYLPSTEYRMNVTGLSSGIDRTKLVRSTFQNWTPPDSSPPLPP